MNTETTSTSNGATIDKDDVIDGAITEIKAPDNALVITNPEQFAKELFAPFHAELTKTKRRAAKEQYDITKPEGMALAKELAKTFQKIRTRADAVKSEAKKPIDLCGKVLLSGFNTLGAAAKAEEDKHNAAISAEDARLAAERQKKLDDERARVEALEAKVDAIRLYPSTMVSADSERLREALVEWENKRLDPEEFKEYTEDALTALNISVDQLRAQLVAAEEREADARKRKADEEELERLKAEKIQREADDARRQKEAEEAAAEQARQVAAQQQALADQQEQLMRQQSAMVAIQAINHRAQFDGTALELHRALVEAQAIVVDAATFGSMESMAQMAKEMTITAIGTKYSARLAAELPAAHDEAILENDAFEASQPVAEAYVEPAPAPRRMGGGGGSWGHFAPVAVEPAPERAPSFELEPSPAAQPEVAEAQRPTNAEILDLVANHYCVFPATALTWLRDLVNDVTL